MRKRLLPGIAVVTSWGRWFSQLRRCSPNPRWPARFRRGRGAVRTTSRPAPVFRASGRHPSHGVGEDVDGNETCFYTTNNTTSVSVWSRSGAMTVFDITPA
jgi:hypothetical protein